MGRINIAAASAPISRTTPMNRRDVLAAGLASLSTAMLARTALAYPERTIRLVVPFSPGGATDVVGRLWAEKMKPLLGTVVTENRGGGGGVTGAAEVARAQPDGHTFLFGNTSTQVLIPAIMSNPPYDPLKDFVGIYILCNAPTSIVIHESVPARNLQELIAYARANPGKLSYGSAGAGTLTNLAGELFKQLIGAPDIVHIPYKGSAPGVADLASGHIPMMTPNVGGPLLEFHRAGRVRILAVNAAKRIQAAPDIPTALEAGLAGMIAGNLNGLFAPAGIPKPIVDRIADATRRVMAEADVQRILVTSGFEPITDSSPDATRQFVSEETVRWVPIMRAANFKME
jgi:tripartite-type tricarboxylate transporter receptor subunit TctC